MFYIDPITQKAIRKFPHRAADIAKSFDEKQIKCKQWLYEELLKCNLPEKKKIYIAGAWFGTTVIPLIRNIYPNSQIIAHDLDEEVIKISKSLYFPEDDSIRFIEKDCELETYHDMLINTSCEHMQPLMCRKKTYVILQSNNYTEIEEHINCVNSPDELARQYNVSRLYYMGELKFQNYTRYMVIGKI
jgi:hypothetical protein